MIPHCRSTVIALCLALLAPLAAQAAERKVSIDALKYSPAEIKIKAGDTVVWTNDDQRDHTVTAADGSFASGNMKSRDTFEHQFKKKGKYKYNCDYHPRMKGTVVVE